MRTIKAGAWRWSGIYVLAMAGALGCASSAPESADESAAEVQAELETRPAFVSLLETQVPGFSVALVDERGVLWSKGYGLASLRTKARVTADTAFWLASVSKAVMGTALAHAEERGLLSLDTDVRKLVAARGRFRLALPDDSPLPLEQLVTHTSPVRDSKYYACSYYVGAEHGKRTSLFNAFHHVGTDFTDPLLDDLVCDEQSPASLGGFLRSYLDRRGEYYSSDNFGPAAVPVYSNVGAGLAGYALELASGRSLAEYAKAQLFRPLGMDHTSWELDDFSRLQVATPYVWDPPQSDYVEFPLYSLSTWPDGGLRSSARELGRFLATIINLGTLEGTRILKTQSVERMLTPRVIDEEEGVGYGTFWATFMGEGGNLIGHTGGDPGAASLMLFDPEQRVGVVLLTNTDFERLIEPLQSGLLGELFDAARRLHAQRR